MINMRWQVKCVVALLIIATMTGSLAACTKANNPPTITSLIADAYSVASGTGSHITCTASDEDGDTLSYTWMASGGNISGVGDAITWIAPSLAGTYSICVTVHDGNGYTTQSTVMINVQPTPTPEPTPTLTAISTPIPTPTYTPASTAGCPAGHSSAINDPIQCCPNGEPYYWSSDGQCHVNTWTALTPTPTPTPMSTFTPITLDLTQIVAVCSSCAPELLEAKIQGIREAIQRMVNYCGADIPPDIYPITFYLEGNTLCGHYTEGNTGFFWVDSSGHGYICMWDMEKENRSLSFTVENASKIEDQMLPVHEAMHGWFHGRQQNYRIEEPFCKWVSFVITEVPDSPDYCNWFSSTPDDQPEALMKYLCQMGITSQQVAQILNETAESADAMGRALSDAEFADIVSAVLGQDAIPAFQAAGILP